jgi:hypothetical protein
MKKLASAALTAVVAALVLAPAAGAGLPNPKDTKRIEVPDSIAGVALKEKIKRADKAWGRRGDCDFKGFQSCVYEGRNPRAGKAMIEAARRGNVSSFGIYAGRDEKDGYVFKGKLLRFETKEGIGLGSKGSRVPKAYPKAIRTANGTGYIVPTKGHPYMTFQTLDGKRITAITVVDGKHQG